MQSYLIPKSQLHLRIIQEEKSKEINRNAPDKTPEHLSKPHSIHTFRQPTHLIAKKKRQVLMQINE